MNILMFDYEYPPLGGGGGVVHQLLAEELARRHRVTLVTSAFQDLPSFEIQRGVEIHRVPILGRNDRATASMLSMLTYPAPAFFKARHLIRGERYDVINGHFAVPTCPASLPIARLHGIPHVTSLHGGDIYDPSKRFSPHRVPGVRGVVRAILQHSDAVVAQSGNTRDNARKHYNFNGAIDVIPLGIKGMPEVPSATREELSLPPDQFLTVTVGRLIARKRIDHLLRALAREACHDVSLVIVGEGPEGPLLQALADELGVSNRVIFAGRVEEHRKWQILQLADAYVSTTMHEGFGLVFLEGMAAGLPVITYDHGGHLDFLDDGQTGRLVPEGQLDALAKALSQAAKDPEGTARMGRDNVEVASKYEIGHCAESYETLFTAMVERAA